MQKVIQRTIMAEKQAARRLAKRRSIFKLQQEKTNREQYNMSRSIEIQDVKAATLARREDWEMGPLAPKRDVGLKKDTWGAIDSQRLRGRVWSLEKRKEILKPWGGETWLNLAKGDRVVMLEGREKGMIAEVKSIDLERCQVTLDGANMVDVRIPAYMIQGNDEDKRLFRPMEQPVDISTVRLVYPLQKQGEEVKDVIVKNIKGKPTREELINYRMTGKAEHRRYVAGTKIELPWPRKEDEDFKDHPEDTLRIDVELPTFIPTLLRPPFPSSVIDELRNKFSAFRTRHNPEYIAAKMQEDKEKEAKKIQIKQMRTPLNEINRQERRLKKKMGKKQVLTPEMLQKLGAIMAQKKALHEKVTAVQQGREPVAA
ncbi:hypothetical protein BJ878DRAFT_94797 [Calycina marina]|uniref:KOW domain-containing protein n=1 Tax=Calycina marina TaxID=1763456 RepID=A0A9P7Z2C1_9HELO|nr:hypothetical protein BJ878DRAFT_94797 [Calycina marina]